MASDREAGRWTTRRAALYGAGGVLGAGLLSGCLGGGDTDPVRAENDEGEPTDATPSGDANGEGGEVDAGDGQDETGYTVTLSPAGTVEFDAVPETVFTVYSQYVDMAVALGHGDAVNAMYVPEMAGTTMNAYYHHLEGVSFDWEGLYDPLVDGFSKEKLYDLDSDVHLADPAWASTQGAWDRDDIHEIAESVGPWFGNFYSGTHAAPPAGYDDYEYYDLWELFERVAAVFREEARYEALAAIHADLLARIERNLPPESDRPTAVRVSMASDGASFYTYHLNEPGYWLADTRPLGAVDAFAEAEWGSLWGQVDFETMAEADPDVILHLWGMTPSRSMNEFRSTLEDHPVGSTLAAVETGRLYAQGMRYQGPIMNLFQLEMCAKQLYPSIFGEWPTYEDGEPYPTIPAEEWLFDRDAVAAAVNGEG